jgi:hypothetical protein
MIQQVGINPILSRWVNSQIKPNIPDAETAWFMQRIGQLSEGEYGAYLHQNGWADKFAGALGWAWTRQPPIEILLEMFRRKYINMDTLTERLKWYRFDDAMIANTTQLSTNRNIRVSQSSRHLWFRTILGRHMARSSNEVSRHKHCDGFA